MDSVRADMLDPAQTVPVQINFVQTNTVQSNIVQTETDPTDLVHTEMVHATNCTQGFCVDQLSWDWNRAERDTAETEIVQTATFIETAQNKIDLSNFNQTETVQTDPVLTETGEPVHSGTVLTDIMQTATVQRDPAPTDFRYCSDRHVNHQWNRWHCQFGRCRAVAVTTGQNYTWSFSQDN